MQPSTIVPPHRFGQLLTEARLEAGHDLEDLALDSDGLFTVGELADIENGHRHLDDRVIEAVTGLYAVGCGPIVPQRAELTIDLDRNLVSAAGRSMPLGVATREHVLDRYLSLVYVLRNREPGTKVPLRQEDVDILAASLAERSELIEEQLLAAMLARPERISGLSSWFRGRLWVPGAGALVGVVSVGALVMVGGTAADSSTEVRTLPVPDPAPDPDSATQAAPTTVPSVAILSEASSTVETRPPEATVPPSADLDVATPTTSVAPTAPPSSIPAPATTIAPTTPAPVAVTSASAAQLGAEAEALLPIDVAATLPDWEIRYLGHNDSFRGLTFPYDKTIEVYVRDNDTPFELAGIVAHEVGHALDVEFFSSGHRAEWKRTRRIADRPWWPDAYASDFQTGAGDFAEAFASWSIGSENHSEIGGDLTGEQLSVLEDLLRPYLVFG